MYLALYKCTFTYLFTCQTLPVDVDVLFLHNLKAVWCMTKCFKCVCGGEFAYYCNFNTDIYLCNLCLFLF